MLAYSFEEALASLVRGGRAAVMSMGTIATAFLALGGFLLVTGNLQRVVQQWMESAEVSVFLRDDASEAARAAVESALGTRPGVVEVAYLSKEDALSRFRTDFPELADVTTTLGLNPFPASFEVRLQPGPGVADEAAALAAAVVDVEGVADVQFDRQWLERLLSLIAGVRAAGIVVTIVLLLGAAFTVTAVVRLSLHARRAEIDIMQLVGAPMGFIRGPFVTEGMLLGGIGAVLAILLLAGGFAATRSSLGAGLAGLAGADAVAFLTGGDMLLLVGAGLSVGALAGFVASRSAR
ncbi:MAG TPA: ABC transporter permease [Vicinamibacterales bacterium]|nr:ABC transporter permease [Vicinamibacterales bacterium]